MDSQPADPPEQPYPPDRAVQAIPADPGDQTDQTDQADQARRARDVAARVSVRPARTEDADAVTSVFLRARAHAMPYLPRLHTDEQTAAWIRGVVLAGQHVWVAHTATHVVGFAAVEDGVLEHLYVDPDRQGRGVGTRLLERARAGRDRLDLFVFVRNTAARAFYERHGFALAELRDGSANEENEPDARYRSAPPS